MPRRYPTEAELQARREWQVIDWQLAQASRSGVVGYELENGVIAVYHRGQNINNLCGWTAARAMHPSICSLREYQSRRSA